MYGMASLTDKSKRSVSKTATSINDLAKYAIEQMQAPITREETIILQQLSHNLRFGSAITLCCKSHIALVQYRFLLPRFPIVTLLQTGRKQCHL